MASLPQVGLEAVIAGLPGFMSGANAINSAYDSMEKKAGNVEKATGGMGKAFSGITSSIGGVANQFVGLGEGILKFGAIAGGAALVGVGALTAGIIALGTSAFSEFSKYERLSMSITNLTAREISQGTVVEQQIQTRISLTAAETEELNKLKAGMDSDINRRTIMTATIQEQEEKIRQLTAQYGESGLVVIKERAELEGMRLKLSAINGEIDTHNARIQELIDKNGQMVTTLQKVRTGQMSMSDAMQQAGPRAKELLKWIQLLAIQSPFSSEGVAQAFKTALSYGFTTKEAQRLTEAMIDFTAATGASEEVAKGISLALGQMRARGKLSAEELNQLSERGVGVNAILERMGYSLGDVTKGMVDVNQFIEAVIQDMEIFGGSAKQQANSFAGLTASLGDIKAIGLREFFTGTFKAIQPYTAAFTGWLTQITLETSTVRDLGEALGTYVAGGLSEISRFIKVLRAGGLATFSTYLGTEGIPLWYELKKVVGNVTKAFSSLGSLFSGSVSGLFSNFANQILPAITQGLAFVNDHFEELKGALMGIGVVLGIGVFAAIAAGLLSLITPMNLIIAGAAVLGAAWAGNWYGIRDTVTNVIGYISGLITTFQAGGLFGSRSGSFGSVGLLAALGIPPDIISVIQNVFTQISGLVNTFLTQGFFGQAIAGGMTQSGGLLRAIGLSDETVTILQNALNAITSQISTWLGGTSGLFTSANLAAVIGGIGTAFTVAGGLIVQAINYIVPALATVVTWLQTNIPVAVQYVSGIWTSTLYPALIVVGAWITETLIPVLTQMWTWFQTNLPVAIQFLTSIWNTILYPALTTVGTWITTVLIPTLGQIVTWLQINIPAAVQTTSDFWNNVLLPALTTVGTYIEQNITPLFQAFNDFLLAVFNKTIQAAAGLWQNILHPALIKVSNTFKIDLMPIFTSLSDFIANSLTPNLNTLGGDVFPSLTKALEEVTRWIKEATNFFQSMADAVNSFTLPEVLQRHSPSPFEQTLMGIANYASKAGLSLTQLNKLKAPGMYDQLFKINRGLLDFNYLMRQAENGITQWAKDRNINPDKARAAIRIYEKLFSANFASLSKSPTGEADFLKMVRKVGAWRGLDLDPNKAVQMGQKFFKNFFAEAQIQASKLQDMIITGSQEALQLGSQLNQFAKAQSEYLDDQVKTLQEFVDSGQESFDFNGQILGTVEAQTLLNQKLEEQKEIQNDILKVKQQESKLQFLEQQLGLIKMVKDAGLNVKDVLGGITFGLNASIPDMLAATNNVIQSIIGQVDRDLGNIMNVGAGIGGALTGGVVSALGIGSPSKVMQGIADNVVGSFVDRMATQMGYIRSAIDSTIVVPAAQAVSNVSNAVTNNNYFSMDVQTTATPQATIQQYQVMRAMVT